MRALYVVGTRQHVGKTTFCIGLISALRQRGLNVGYTKPLGQRISTVAGQPIHDDALVVSQAMDIESAESATMAVPLTSGRVEQEIYDLHAPELAEKVASVCRRLRAAHDVVVVEGMGHVAMGSCLKLSAADVARIIGAKALLISGGGIGRTIDNISLCGTFLAARGAEMMGAVVNKVWPEKYQRVRQATTKGLDNLGIRSFGTMPYEQVLASPTVAHVGQQLGCEVLAGQAGLDSRVGQTIVAAMEAHHMVGYLKERSLVITPGDRSDNILAILSTYALSKGSDPPVVGIILTGGFRPMGRVMEMLHESGLPALLTGQDTYATAARLRETTFKLIPQDKQRIAAAMALVKEHVDVDGILDELRE